MSLSTIIATAQENKRPVSIGYLVAGFPHNDTFTKTVTEVAQYCDIVEIAIPFSDPVADSPMAEKIGLEGVAKGINFAYVFAALASLPREITSRLIISGYYNNFLQYTFPRLAEQCQALGITTVMIHDLPTGEDGLLRASCPSLQIVPLLAAATTQERIDAYTQKPAPLVFIVPAIEASGADNAIQRCLTTLEATQELFAEPMGIRFDASALPKNYREKAAFVWHETALLEHIQTGKSVASFFGK